MYGVKFDLMGISQGFVWVWIEKIMCRPAQGFADVTQIVLVQCERSFVGLGARRLQVIEIKGGLRLRRASRRT